MDSVGRSPFLEDGVVTVVGPRIDARIMDEEGEEGRWVPGPGLYDDDGARGWPGRPI